MSWITVKLSKVLKQYRITHLVNNNKVYKQVTISKHEGVIYRGEKLGKDIGRKRQFIVDLDKFPNTVMLVRQGVYDGAIGFAPKEVNGCIATENMPMFSVENINVKYLDLVIRSDFFKKQIAKIQTTGSAQKSIHERQILELEIFLPPENEQLEIVERVSLLKLKFDEISDELIKQLVILKKLRQQILQDAIQGKLVPQNVTDEPASVLLEKIKAEKEILIKEKKIKKDKPLPTIKPEKIPFEIPESWVWCRLREIAEIGTGATPLTSNYDYYTNGNIPWITSSATNNSFVCKPELYITEKALKETNCKIYPVGTLVIAMYGQGKTRGQITELKFAAATNQACATILFYLNDIIIKSFIKIFFQKTYQELRELARGGSQPNLNISKIKDFLIPLPSINEQHRILKKFEQITNNCNKLEIAIKNNQEYCKSLFNEITKIKKNILPEAL